MEKVVKSSLETEYEGNIWVAEWTSFISSDGTETKDRWLSISRREQDGTLTNIDDLPYDEVDTREVITQRLASKRVEAIQAEYGLPSDDADECAIAELIFARVWSGEWMGQLRDSYGFYLDNLASIFDKDFLEVAQIVRKLNLQEKVGLNGFIIVPWVEEETAYKSWEKSTGHKRLHVSDGHGWGCGHCGKHGDEREPWASKVPCVTETERALS